MSFLSNLYGWLKSNKELLLLGLIIAVGSFLRIYNLGTESIWWDESTSVDFSSGSLYSIITGTAGRNNPPLYWILLHFWIKFFGTSEAAIRSLSAVFGIFAIFVTYLVGKELFNRRVGLITSFISAISYFHIYYSQEARPYALLLLSSLLLYLFFIKILKSNKNRYYLFYLVTIWLIGYTHIYGFFVIASQVLIFLIFWYKYKPLTVRLVITWIISLVGLLPLVRLLGSKTINIVENGLWIHRPNFNNILNTFTTFAGYGKYNEYLITIFIAFVLFGLIFSGRREGNWIIGKPFGYLQKGNWKTWLTSCEYLLILLIWLSVPIIIPYLISLYITPIYVTRYTMGASPALFLLVSKGIDNLSLKKLIYPVLAVITIISSYGLYYYYVNDVKTQWREAVEYVELHSQENDILIFCESGTWRPFNYYYKGDLEEFKISRSEDDVQVMSEFINETIIGKDRIWVILSHGGQTAPFRAYTLEQFEDKVVSDKKFNGIELVLVDLNQDN